MIFYQDIDRLVERNESNSARLEFSCNESNLINYFFLVNFVLFVVIFPLLTCFIFYLLNHTFYLNTLLEKTESNIKIFDIVNIPNTKLDSAQVAAAQLIETVFKTEKKISRIKMTWLWISQQLKQGLDNGFQMSIQIAVSMAITYCALETGKYIYSKIGRISTGVNFIYSKVYHVAARIREIELCNAFVESIGDCLLIHAKKVGSLIVSVTSPFTTAIKST